MTAASNPSAAKTSPALRSRKVLCEGTGRKSRRGETIIYPCCPVCGREMSAQGRKAQARFANAWQSIPKHYRKPWAERVPL